MIFAICENINNRNDEYSIAARQSRVVLPNLLVNKVTYSMAKAEQEAKRGKTHTILNLMPNLGGTRRQEAISSTAHTSAAQNAQDDFQQITGEGSRPSSQSRPLRLMLRR